MAYSSPTGINLTSSPLGLFVWLNDVTNYWFSNALIMSIWVLFFMGFLSVERDDYIGASAVASYVTTILTLFLWIIGLASGWAFSIVIGLSLISTAWLLADRRGTA